MTTDSQKAVEVRNLVKTYDGKKNAVDDLSFSVEKGEIYGLLGKNGAGKSTTIKVLTTLIPPSAGTVHVSGLDLRKKPNSIRKIVGVVQQEEAFDFTTVENNFKIYGMLWEVPKAVVKERMDQLIELFNLSELRRKRVFELSGGQKKRLQVAREFIHDMDVLFLDEPTVGMDPIMRRKVLDFVKEKAKGGLTVMFTTQILEEADYICDRIGIIDNGKLVAEGTSRQLKDQFGSVKKLEITMHNVLEDAEKNDVSDFIRNADGVTDFQVRGRSIWIVGNNMSRILNLMIKKITSMSIEIDQIIFDAPSLDDVFLEVVKR
ncbi:multidrug ABC transporter ATPase [uncultured archaeon]|nr:multidrug ABC transporter ATPase [uncultured archaeon]